ncbi:hypothetical protein ACP4OV_006797 [Aristida adscensionis]
MDTFLTPLPAPPPVFAPTHADADADDFSSIVALLAMHADFAAPPPAATDFFFHQDDSAQGGAVMPSPPLFLQPTSSTATGKRRRFSPAADDGATDAASRPAKSIRRTQQSSSPPEPEGVQAAAAAAAGARSARRVWVRERSTEWWDRLGAAACPEADFRRAFRMSRATFHALCDALGPAGAGEDTALRAAIPAVCLCRLATGEPLRELARRFGVGISTCHSIVLQVCAALAAVLMPTAIRWPNAPAAAAARFQAASGIPDVVGAVHTTHVPVVAPKADVAAHYNRRLTERNNKTTYSVAVQAVTVTDTEWWDLPSMIAACCVLHNICERAGEELDPDLMQYELDDDDIVLAQDAISCAGTAQTRDGIAHDLLHGSHATDTTFQM